MIKRSDTCAKQGSDVRYFHAKNYFSWEGGGAIALSGFIVSPLECTSHLTIQMDNGMS